MKSYSYMDSWKVYDNLDDESRRADAFHQLRRMAEKAQEEALSLADSMGTR